MFTAPSHRASVMLHLSKSLSSLFIMITLSMCSSSATPVGLAQAINTPSQGTCSAESTECAQESLSNRELREGDVRFFPRDKISPGDSLEDFVDVLSEADKKEIEEEGCQLLLLARHGQTNMNSAGLMQGRGINAPLNDHGRAQALELGKFLANTKFHITSSSLDRAYETAFLVGQKSVSDASESFSDSIERLAGLDELGWGGLEGKSVDIEPQHSALQRLKQAWLNGDYDAAAEGGGDSPNDVYRRASAAIQEVLARGHRRNLIVTHGRTIRILLLGLTGRPFSEMEELGKVPNTALYAFMCKKGTYTLLRPVKGHEKEDSLDEESE